MTEPVTPPDFSDESRGSRHESSRVDHPPIGDLGDHRLYFNRELSWLDFNDRVLQLVEDSRHPLLERVKFAAIYASNLDEFFMIRAAGLEDQIDAGVTAVGPDGRTALETIEAIRARVVAMSDRHSRVITQELFPALAKHGIRIMQLSDLDEEAHRKLTEHFQRQILPALTPLAVGPGRPFPYISGLSLSLAILVRDPVSQITTFARVKVPKEMFARFIRLNQQTVLYIPLEQLISDHLAALFPGMDILDHGVFRVTRDADFEVSDEADDLLEAIQTELRRRRFGGTVRLEIDRKMSSVLRAELISALSIEARQVYEVDGLVDATDLWQIVKLPGFNDLRDESWKPITQPRLQSSGEGSDIFSEIRRNDILVHHPYDSFTTSVEQFVAQAVKDPDVLAIKQTVYRTSDESPLVPNLMHAAERGKQAVCLVELKARFDEAANIEWAKKLEQSGVHVVYGLPALKTHAKCILVVRREGDGVRHYVHIGTGNYHATTARLYTDFGLFTCDEAIGADVADMFNFLTGFARPPRYRKVLVAPEGLRDGILREIERTIEAARRGEQAQIILKLNALVDRRCIRALYRASQAGVSVDMNVRGICCLRAGIKGVSENIRVVSVLGRFLEHSRIFAFQSGEDIRVFIGSADLMPRNLDARVELLTPIQEQGARSELFDTLQRSLADTTGAWDLQGDGSWQRRELSQQPRSVQIELMRKHAVRAVEGDL